MAETEEIGKRFKDLPIRILTSSIKEREAIFNELNDVLSKNDVPGGFVKGLCRLLHHVLHRYNDSKSRRLVEVLITTLMTFHYETTLKSLLALFREISTGMKNLSATSNTARTSLRALSWSTCFTLSAFKKNNPMSMENDFAELVEAQCFLLGAIVAAGNEGLMRKAAHKLSIVWKQVPNSVCQYADVIVAMDQNFCTVVFASLVLKHMGDMKDNSNVSNYKIPFLEGYIKVVISSKTKPPLYVLNNDKHILKYVSHEEFKQTLLPALQKAMLRNPEVILESVGCVLSDLSIDMSSYALNLGKTLTTYLHSKDNSTRDDAASACTFLAQQCSDAEAIQEVLRHLFTVLNGSEGKLSITGQRMSMLTGIGNFVNNTVTGNSSHQLAYFVTKEFIALLQSEVHEGTLVHMLSVLSLWCAKYTNEVPSELIEWFPKALNLKTSTAAVRNGYMMCMNTAFNNKCLTQAQELVPLLLRTVEKAAAQPLQHPIVSEGLTACYLLLRLVASDIISDVKLGSFWNIVLDMDKQVFVSEKFLSLASEDVMQYVVLMVERLIVDHPQRLNQPQPLYRALIFALTHPSLKLQRQCQTLTRKLLTQLASSSLACSLVEEFASFINNAKNSELDQDKQNGDVNSAEGNSNFRGRILADCLSCIVSGTYDLSDNEKLALATLVCAHHPCIVSEVPYLWTQLLQRLKVIPYTFVKNNIVKIMENITKDLPVSQSAIKAMETLVKLNIDTMPPLLEKIEEYLGNDSLMVVTNEEYAIFQTADGELYDSSVIENAKVDTVINKNIKRESKAYSYREQLEEIELRKEIEAKKKAKGTKIEPEYSPKQQEAIKAQLAKELQIRIKIKEFHQQVVSATSLMKATISGNPEGIIPFVPKMVHLIVPTFQSPVAAQLTTSIYLDIMPVVLAEEMKPVGDLIAHMALRMLKPQCKLDKAWDDEDIGKAVLRCVKLLHKLTVKAEETPEFNAIDDNPEAETLTAPAFAYCFPFLKCVLKNGGESAENDQETIVQALEIIAEHVHMRATSVDDLSHPQHLPRKEMMELFVQLVGLTAGKIQQLTCNVFFDIALCASGLEGTAEATQDEIVVLLKAMQSNLLAIREVAIKSLSVFILILPTIENDRESGFNLIRRVWVARFDTSEDVQKIAEKLWNDAGLELEPELSQYLLQDVIHVETVVREAAAAALAEFLKFHFDQLKPVLQKLIEMYREKLVLPPPVLDNFGRIVSDEPLDNWEPRSGIAIAIGKLAPMFKEAMLPDLMNFFVKEGLGDRHREVQKNMLLAALATVDAHGKETVNSLLPVFEQFLDKAPNKASYDSVRQSVIVLMGALARHLDKDDPKVKPIVAKLVESLSTPSQQVQEAVANCLPPLVPAIKEETPVLVKKLLKLLLESSSYGERKGASYGLAGLVKGLGILALKQLEIITTLTEAIQDKKNARHREGALFAFEQLCNMLGRLFEPYIVHVLPHLLLCFGDQNHHVRQATDDTAKAVMSKLSVHGVKMVLPSLLSALEEDSWRTKTGSIELLGAMAFCAPKQLSSCLPSIVPKLIEILSDSHVKVQKAGAQALKLIGSVIRNPEIQAIVPNLLDALQDPSKKTAMCLQTLLDTKFVHFIDAPSLALIMPVVQRAFQDRSTETRKMAAQIIGNMYSLTDHKDLAPYLPHVLPGLKQSLLDPVPEVRSVSARALGAMVRGMGEGNFEDLLPWLMQTLTSEQSSVDRSGAAQGLSEVVGGLGNEKLQKLMPDIIAMAERSDIPPHVKDGYIMMFIYMPVVFQKEFTPYIGSIINPILKALADENEYVRDTALRAGQRIVNMYAESAITLLLPELEKGLFDDNWRIRYSSVQLLGDLLYKISGVSGKMSTETADEDDNFGTEHSHKAIMNALGAERRNRVLAGLYMGRSDVALMVRQAALHVWKVVVTNTPRTLREILPTLFSLLLGCLASTSMEKRQVAARTLGDLVRKLGERVLPEIIPILEKGLESEHSDQRQGVCIGLGEIMSSTNRDMVLTFVDSLVPTVRKALCDPLPEVRHAAAKTFDSLHSTVGVRALDDILPSLLRQLDNPEIGEYTLDGLRQVMTIKSRVVLPYLVPQLTSPPVNTKALSILASVAGDALTKHLHKILPALLSALSAASGKPKEQQELEYCQTVVLSVTDMVGVRTMMDEFIEETRSESVEMRRAAVALLYAFCLNTKADYQQYVPQLFRGLIHLFTEKDERVLHLSWEALNAVTKKLDAPEMAQHVANVRQAVRFAVSDLKGQQLLPGFCLPKGITPILPIFREAILNGPPELKEQAAQGLGEVIRLTSAEALKPSVVNITGPLIRILGDRFNWNVKVAVLDALALLLAKVGVMLKAFLPQLQTTFLKALSDPNRQVRLKAGAALSHLIVIHTRVDPLFTELHMAVKNTDDAAVRETMLQALRVIIGPSGDKIGDTVRKMMMQTLLNLLSYHEDTSRMAAAGCIGALCQWLPEEELCQFAHEHLLEDDASADRNLRHGRSVAFIVALKEAPARILKDEWIDKITKVLLSLLMADRVPLALNGVRGIGYFFKYQIGANKLTTTPLITSFARSMNHSSNEVKQLVAQVSHYLAKCFDALLPDILLKPLLPMLVNGTKEKNTMVKANSEFALVAILKLRQHDETYMVCMNLLDSGAREAMGDVINKVLRKVANQPEPKEEDFDDTLLT